MKIFGIRAKAGKTSDIFFLSLLAFLVIFGLVMLASASSEMGKEKFNDTYFFLKHQLASGLGIGLIGFAAGFFLYYRFWAKFAPWLLLLNIMLLILVFVPGIGSSSGTEADRWLDFGLFSFQPSELMKLTFIIYLAAWLSGKQRERSSNFVEGFLPFLSICGLIAILLFLQPSTTTAVLIVGAGLITYFMAGAKIRFLALAGLLTMLAVILLITVTPYRLGRVQVFLSNLGLSDVPTDPLGDNYHLERAFDAIGLGGWHGVGYGKSTTKISLLPEPIGDSIFAVIAEELGFIGSMFLITLFFLFVWRGIQIAKRNREPFGRLLATGFASIIGLQAFINIAAISGILPPTGVPLPFVSYGGTSLLAVMTMSGIIANISKYRS